MWLLDSLCLRSNLSQQPCLHALDYVCAVQHAAEACRAFNESAISLSADHWFHVITNALQSFTCLFTPHSSSRVEIITMS